jgi:sortase A
MNLLMRLVARTFQVAGALFLGYSAFVLVRAQIFQAYEQRLFEQAAGNSQRTELAVPVTPVPTTPIPVMPVPVTPDPDSPQYPIWVPGASHRPAPKPDSLLGRIEIPRLHLSTMILEGDDERQLQLGAGHVPGTTLPGQAGNVVIAAHRDTFFRALQNISTNDRIVLTTLAGSYQYNVEYFGITNPENTSVMKASADRALTLVTCYPFSFIGPAPKRFIVHARLIQ